MISWLSAMAVALVLFALGPINRAQYLRVWGAMLSGLPVAWLLASILPAELMAWVYIVIDLTIAAVIMMEPKALWQRAIGLCYIGMALLTTGYMIRYLAGVYFSLSPATNTEMLNNANGYLGWAATAVLLLAGGNGVLATYWHRAGVGGGVRAAIQRRVR